MNNKLYDIEGLEEFNNRSWVQEFIRQVGELPSEERAYRVIRSFFQTRQPEQKVITDFLVWLCDENNAEAKERALKRVLNEISQEG